MASPGGGDIRTADGGLTWASAQIPRVGNTIEGLHVDAEGARWVGARDGLYRSSDGGATFVDRRAGLYDPGVTEIIPLAGGSTLHGAGGLLVATQGGGLFSVEAGATAGEPDTPTRTALHLATYPNPAAGPLTIAATLSAPAEARLIVLGALGRHIAVLHEGPLAAGSHRFVLDASRLAPGTYLVRAEGAG